MDLRYTGSVGPVVSKVPTFTLTRIKPANVTFKTLAGFILFCLNFLLPSSGDQTPCSSNEQKLLHLSSQNYAALFGEFYGMTVLH